MATHFMATVTMVMLALFLFRPHYIRFLAPIWIILFLVAGGYEKTTYGLVAIVIFVLLLVAFVLDEVRDHLGKGKTGVKDKAVTLFEDEKNDSKDSTRSKPKRTKVTVYEGTLLSHGFAPYKNDSNNDRSYFVNCDGENVWGIGLKDAILNCGAQNGDKVRFWKETEVRTDNATVFDEDGKAIGKRKLDTDKRRGIWVMEKA